MGGKRTDRFGIKVAIVAIASRLKAAGWKSGKGRSLAGAARHSVVNAISKPEPFAIKILTALSVYGCYLVARIAGRCPELVAPWVKDVTGWAKGNHSLAGAIEGCRPFASSAAPAPALEIDSESDLHLPRLFRWSHRTRQALLDEQSGRGPSIMGAFRQQRGMRVKMGLG